MQVDWVLCKLFNKNKSEFCAKQELGSINYEFDDNRKTNSWTLPPLMEPYISFDQIDEQVSCFSILTPNPNFSNLAHMDQDLSTQIMTILPDQLEVQINSNISCDENEVTDILKHVFTRDTTNRSPSFGEGSSESYLSEVGLQQPSMWNY